jgi:hypothetical protein
MTNKQTNKQSKKYDRIVDVKAKYNCDNLVSVCLRVSLRTWHS